MAFLSYLVVAVVAYLLGSIPFGFLLVLLFRKEDIRARGSGNIGATNVVRSGAKGLGLLTFLLDVGKGYAAVIAAGWLLHFVTADATNLQNARSIAAMAAILGHVFPVWLRFKGGKGVATALGVFLALIPLAALIGLAVFAAVLLAWRYVSLASIASAVAFPIAGMLLARGQRTPLFTIIIVAIPLLVIWKHRQNISRLLHGTEYRFGKPKASAV